MIQILIVDDEKPICDLIQMSLTRAGYHCMCVYDGLAAADILERNVFDLILLDVMLPNADGFELMEYIRPLGIPVIFLTARGSVDDRVRGLRRGAEDYLPKPFSFAELSARVKALLRRYCVYQGKGQVAAQPENLKLISNGVQLALDCNRVWVEEREVDLTETEYKILRMLMQNPERIFSVEMIYETVWGEPYYYTSNGTVMVHIRNLRTKIEADPQNPKRVCTVWGKGYRFVSEEQV